MNTANITGTKNGVSGGATITVSNPPPPPPSITVTTQSINAQGSIARDRCLTVVAGDAAAYECGDLRLVHPLPTIKSMNRDRTPTLVYNSRQAKSIALIAANVTVSNASPDSIRATLTIPGKSPVTHAYAWNSSCASVQCRIVVPVDSMNSLPTGYYTYTLQVQITVSGTPYAANDNNAFAVVNRATSPFGSGWWLDSWEQLVQIQPDTMLWVGGDGSTRRYPKAAVVGTDTIFIVQQLVDRRDTLVHQASGKWQRHLPNGAIVEFNSTLQHTRTINAEGQVTFFYVSSQLDSVVAPVPAGSAARSSYLFTYGGGVVTSVSAPDRTGGGRTVTIAHGTTYQVTGITDPDANTINFAYDSTALRIASRRNKLGDTTFFVYDAKGGLKTDSLSMSRTGGSPIVTRFCAAETRSLDTCAGDSATATPQPLGRAVTRLAGPRVAGDTTRFFINRFGAPDTVVNALGQYTRVHRSNQFPALGTAVIAANGFGVDPISWTPYSP